MILVGITVLFVAILVFLTQQRKKGHLGQAGVPDQASKQVRFIAVAIIVVCVLAVVYLLATAAKPASAKAAASSRIPSS